MLNRGRGLTAWTRDLFFAWFVGLSEAHASEILICVWAF